MIFFTLNYNKISDIFKDIWSPFSNKIVPASILKEKIDFDNDQDEKIPEDEIKIPYPILPLALSFPPQVNEYRPNLERKKSSGRLVNAKKNLENEEEQKLPANENTNRSVTFKTPEIDELWNYTRT